MDGGTVWNVNAEAAISQCMDLVDDESKIIMDILICGAPTAPKKEVEDTDHTLGNYMRGRNFRQYYGSTDQIVYAMQAHPTVDYRYIIGQNSDSYMGGTDELNFNGEFTWQAQEIGRQQG